VISPIWRIFYEVVPGISLFRAPSIAAFLFGFGAVTLMAFGVDRILGLGEWETAGGASGDASDRKLLVFLAAASGVLLFGTLMASGGVLTSLWTSLLYQGMEPGKLEALGRAQPFIARGFLIATALAAAFLVLCWGALRGRVPAGLWALGVGILLALDLGRVDDPFIQTMEFRSWAAPDPNILYLQERQEEEPPFRVLAMAGTSGFGQDVKPGMYGLELANGHHPNDLARYRELIGMVGSGAPENLIDLRTGEPNLQLLSILNVRYVIWPVYRYGGLPQGEVVMASSLDGDRVYEAVYEIPTLPRARLIGEPIVLNDEEAVSYILSDSFRPDREVVLVDDYPGGLPGMAVDGEVQWLEKTPNRSRLRVRSDGPALLVLSENWYPAWRAEVDGMEVPVLRANHSLRALPVPPGEMEVEVYYDAGSLTGPLVLSLASLILVMGAIFLRPGERAPGEGEEA